MKEGLCDTITHTVHHSNLRRFLSSQFVSAYMGASVGLAVCYPMFGFIISIASWEWIFHVSAVAAIFWFICWQYFVYDKPSQHPRIDADELQFITESLGNSTHSDNKVRRPDDF